MGIYKKLTDYLANIDNDAFGEWYVDPKIVEAVVNGKKSEEPYQMPYVSYSEMVEDFLEDVYNFSDNHPEYELNRYSDTLRANGIEWGKESMQNADVSQMDGKVVMALILGAVRADRFCEGVLLSFFRSGVIKKWLLRLKEIDG